MYDNNEYIIILILIIILVNSPTDFITNITLRKSVSSQQVKMDLPYFKSELLLSFDEIGFKSALIYSHMSWYEMATYTIKDGSKIHLHVGDFVTMQVEDYGKCYAIIKGIFKHKGNDNKYYAFIVIDWFEDINKIHPVLRCPLYRITQNVHWRRIHPISVINCVQDVHFIYDITSKLWIKNNYYFTAI